MRGKFELDLLRDDNGDAVVVTGATVTVTIEGTGVAADLYDDITGVSGPGNPFTATGSTIEFFADQDNRYRVDITATSGYSRTLRYRSVTIDVTDVKDYADTAVATHSAEVDNVHGIDSGDSVESVSGAQAKADAVSTNLTTHIDSATPHPNLTLDFDQITWPTEYQIGTPDHIDTLDELVYHWTSAGIMHGCDITDNGDGTVNIDSGYAILHATTDPHLPMYTVSIDAQGPISLTDQSENYIYIDYNAGSPTFNVSTSSTEFNCINKCIAYYIYRDGTFLNIIDAKEQNVDSNRKSRRLFLEFQKFIHGYAGTQLGGDGLALTVTEGAFYYMLERLPHDAFDTSISGTANDNVFTLWYRDGVGGWTETVEQKVIDSTVYDNNTGTPVELPINDFAVSWIYIVHDEPSSLHVVMGDIAVNTQSEAEATSPPTELPGLLGAHGSLIGFVVYQKSATSFINVLSAFTQSFTASAATNHNGLAGLQGGSVNEYYHLTAAQHADLTSLGTMAQQDADSVAITGGAIDGTAIGDTTPAAGTFTEAQKTGTGVTDDDLPSFSQLALAIGRITNPLVDLRLQNGVNLVSGLGSVTFSRASTATYVDLYGVLKTAAIDEPRFEEGGLLIEGSNTNLLTYSEDFTNAAWTKAGTATATASAVVGPDGSATMFLLDGLGAGGTNDIYQSVGTLTASTRYEPSVWMQQATSTTGTIYIRAIRAANTYGQWSVDVSLLSSTSPERITRYHPAVTIDVEFVGEGTGAQYFALSSDGTATDVYVLGAQHEDAPFSTSYIPTTTTALTRSGDFPSLQFDGNFPAINTGELTIIVDYDRIGEAEGNQFVINVGGVSTVRLIASNGSNQRSFTYGNTATSTIASIAQERIGGVFNGTTHKLFVDGELKASATTSGATGTPALINLGHAFSGNHLRGHISRMRIYDVALTDAEMRIA